MSSEKKHTPGPWVIGAGYGRYKTEITGPGRAVASVWTRRDAGALSDERRIEDDPEGIANARLIAAAPELLGLLEEWTADQTECGCDTAACQGNCLPARSRAAIAKATGQEG